VAGELSPASRRAVATATAAAEATARAILSTQRGGEDRGDATFVEDVTKRLLGVSKLRSPDSSVDARSWFVPVPPDGLAKDGLEDPRWAPLRSTERLTAYALGGPGRHILLQALADAAQGTMTTTEITVHGKDDFFKVTTPASPPEGFSSAHAGIIANAFLENVTRSALVKDIQNLAAVRNMADHIAAALVELAEDGKRANANPYALVHRFVAEALGPVHVLTFPAQRGAPRGPELAKLYADVVKEAMASSPAADGHRGKARRDARGGQGDDTSDRSRSRSRDPKKRKPKREASASGGGGGGGGAARGGAPKDRATSAGRGDLYYLAHPDTAWDGKWCINHGPGGHAWDECNFKDEATGKLRDAGFKSPKQGQSANQRKSEYHRFRAATAPLERQLAPASRDTIVGSGHACRDEWASASAIPTTRRHRPLVQTNVHGRWQRPPV
jgi:hypothetical protein